MHAHMHFVVSQHEKYSRLENRATLIGSFWVIFIASARDLDLVTAFWTEAWSLFCLYLFVFCFIYSQNKIPPAIKWHIPIWFLDLLFLGVGCRLMWLNWLPYSQVGFLFVLGNWKYSRLVILSGFRLLDGVISLDISTVALAQRWRVYEGKYLCSP